MNLSGYFFLVFLSLAASAVGRATRHAALLCAVCVRLACIHADRVRAAWAALRCASGRGAALHAAGRGGTALHTLLSLRSLRAPQSVPASGLRGRRRYEGHLSSDDLPLGLIRVEEEARHAVLGDRAGRAAQVAAAALWEDLCGRLRLAEDAVVAEVAAGHGPSRAPVVHLLRLLGRRDPLHLEGGEVRDLARVLCMRGGQELIHGGAKAGRVPALLVRQIAPSLADAVCD